MKPRRYLSLLACLVLAAAIQSQCGCLDSRSTANTQTKRTESGDIRGTIAIPQADGTALPVPVNLTFSRTVAESADTNSQSTTNLDATALGKTIGDAVNVAVRQAVPALSPLLSKPQDGGIAGWIAGGVAALTAGGGGIAAIRKIGQHRADSDEAWDRTADAEKRAAAAEARLEALAGRSA